MRFLTYIATTTQLNNSEKALNVTMLDYMSNGAILIGFAVIGIFLFMIALGYNANRSLSKGEMRRAIAGTFVVGFHGIILFCLLFFPKYTKELIVAYIEFVGLVVGFYFGSRTAQQQVQTEEEISIDRIEGDDDLRVIIRKMTDKPVKITRITVDGKTFPKEVEIKDKVVTIELRKDELEREGIDAKSVGRIEINTESGGVYSWIRV